MSKSTLGFYGGIGSVTGANFILDTGSQKLMVDCGLIQGDREAMLANHDAFGYDPATINTLFVTHAHADHIGRIPKLVKDGFRGVIYATEPTKDLAAVMLRDAHKVMTMEAKRYGTEPLYAAADIDTALSLWQTVSYHEPVTLDDVSVHFTDVGHILGSAMVHVTRGDKKIVFTGDIGNVPQPLLSAPEIPKDYQYLVMESVYGDRLHEKVDERRDILKHHIVETQKKGGTLLIPAFSLERTQGMLFEINAMVESGEIEPIHTFLDSPLAIKVTEIYREYPKYTRVEVQKQIKTEHDHDVFSFPKLKISRTHEDSKHIHKMDKTRSGEAKIIIAGSGMSHGGRIMDHERHYLGNESTTLLLVGYQGVGSIGRILQDGAKRVTIRGQEVDVRAKIATITGYSGHADRDQLMEIVAGGGENAKEVFVTMGEERSSLFLVQRLRDFLGLNARAPEQDEVVEIDF